MMRPFTCLSLVAALGAGLYLYQEKHRATLLDRDINHTVKLADQARDRIGALKAEWALLNDTQRLADLVAHHMPNLQSLLPAQYVRLEDLPGRLPPISTTPVQNGPTDDTPVAAAVARPTGSTANRARHPHGSDGSAGDANQAGGGKSARQAASVRCRQASPA